MNQDRRLLEEIGQHLPQSVEVLSVNSRPSRPVRDVLYDVVSDHLITYRQNSGRFEFTSSWGWPPLGKRFKVTLEPTKSEEYSCTLNHTSILGKTLAFTFTYRRR